MTEDLVDPRGIADLADTSVSHVYMWARTQYDFPEPRIEGKRGRYGWPTQWSLDEIIDWLDAREKTRAPRPVKREGPKIGTAEWISQQLARLRADPATPPSPRALAARLPRDKQSIEARRAGREAVAHEERQQRVATNGMRHLDQLEKRRLWEVMEALYADAHDIDDRSSYARHGKELVYDQDTDTWVLPGLPEDPSYWGDWHPGVAMTGAAHPENRVILGMRQKWLYDFYLNNQYSA